MMGLQREGVGQIRQKPLRGSAARSKALDCQCLVTRIVGPTTERRALGSPPLPVPKRSRGLRRNVPAAQCGEKNLAQSRLRKIFEIVDATRFNFPEADFWPRLNSGLPVQQPRQEL